MIRLPESVMLILSVTVALLFVVAVLFGVAVLIMHARAERRTARHKALEAEWEPKLLEALSADSPARPGDYGVSTRDEVHFLWFLTRYARRLHGPERDIVEQLATPFLQRVAHGTGHRSAEHRAQMIQTLATLGMTGHAQFVVRALDDSSPLVAMTAARGLARRRHARFAPEVLARIDRFTGWNPRFLSAMLSAMGEAASPALRSMLADTTSSSHGRSVAAHALAQLRDLESADIAAGILRTETHRELLAAALTLLGSVGHAGHLDAVWPHVRSTEDWVRAQALETIARLGSPDDSALLEEALADPSPWVAIRAAYGLELNGSTDVLRRLSADQSTGGILAREVLSRGSP